MRITVKFGNTGFGMRMNLKQLFKYMLREVTKWLEKKELPSITGSKQ